MKILMVCLGNICRSPLAEGILQAKIKKHKLDWTVDSAGTSGWHDGELPHRRSIQVARNNGIDITTQISRRITKQDLVDFDLIFVMDDKNEADVLSLADNESQRNKIYLIQKFANEKNVDPNVPDPYFDDKFEYVYNLLDKTCDSVMIKLLKNA